MNDAARLAAPSDRCTAPDSQLPVLRTMPALVLLAAALFGLAAGAGAAPAHPAAESSFANADTTCAVVADGFERRTPDTLTAPHDLTTAAPAVTGSRSVHVVVEIPAGTSEKWEVTADGRHLAIERVDGRRRRIRYLPYPTNYGFIPATRSDPTTGGDGDPIDVILIGPARPCGALVQARVVGMLRLRDDGERDDKILAVSPDAPVDASGGVAGLRNRYPGMLQILETWFTHYEGPGNESRGIAGASEAWSTVHDAARSLEGSSPADR